MYITRETSLSSKTHHGRIVKYQANGILKRHRQDK